MRRFNFWQKWLVVFGSISGLMGVFLAVAPTFFHVEFGYINKAFWEAGVVPDGAKTFYSWIFGVYAAMGIAWALFIVFVASSPFKRKEKWSWYCLTSCISVWFVIDTLFSISFKVYLNTLNNCIFYVLLMLPLIFTKKHFK